MMIRVGTKLYGYCGGNFGRDAYKDKRVEAIGADWVVARDEDGDALFYEGDPEDLEQYTHAEDEEYCVHLYPGMDKRPVDASSYGAYRGDLNDE